MVAKTRVQCSYSITRLAMYVYVWLFTASNGHLLKVARTSSWFYHDCSLRLKRNFSPNAPLLKQNVVASSSGLARAMSRYAAYVRNNKLKLDSWIACCGIVAHLSKNSKRITRATHSQAGFTVPNDESVYTPPLRRVCLKGAAFVTTTLVTTHLFITATSPFILVLD